MLTITYDSTHYYLINCSGGYLQVDSGMPGTYREYVKLLERYDIPLKSIKYLLFTHHHPDHAGIIQELKNGAGAKLIIHEAQIPYLENLKKLYENRQGYVPIYVSSQDLVFTDNSRELLRSIGVQGEIVQTPGHSEDSISLALDEGQAFVGDLHLPYYGTGENYEQTCESWRKLIQLNVKMVYPAHGNSFSIQQVIQALP